MKYIFFIFATIIFTVLNLGHPVTPAFLTSINVSSSMIGYVFAIMSLGLAISSPIWGSKGDQNGRRRYFLIGFLGYGIGQTLFGAASNFQMVLFARLISGVSSGAIIVNFYAYVIENTEKENRNSVISVVGALSAIALSLGYYFGGELGEIVTPSETLYIQGVASIITGIVMFFVFTKKKVTNNKRLTIIESLKSIKNLDSNLILIMLVSLFISSLAYQTVPKYIDLMFTTKGYTTADLGQFVFWSGLLGVPVTLLVVYPLSRKFNLSLLLGISLIGAAISLVLTFALGYDFIFSLYTIFMVHVFFKVFHEPLDITNMSNSSDLDSGILMGIRNSFKAIAQVAGPILGGYIFAYNENLLFYVCSVLLIVSGVIMLKTYKRKDNCNGNSNNNSKEYIKENR